MPTPIQKTVNGVIQDIKVRKVEENQQNRIFHIKQQVEELQATDAQSLLQKLDIQLKRSDGWSLRGYLRLAYTQDPNHGLEFERKTWIQMVLLDARNAETEMVVKTAGAILLKAIKTKNPNFSVPDSLQAYFKQPLVTARPDKVKITIVQRHIHELNELIKDISFSEEAHDPYSSPPEITKSNYNSKLLPEYITRKNATSEAEIATLELNKAIATAKEKEEKKLFAETQASAKARAQARAQAEAEAKARAQEKAEARTLRSEIFALTKRWDDSPHCNKKGATFQHHRDDLFLGKKEEAQVIFPRSKDDSSLEDLRVAQVASLPTGIPQGMIVEYKKKALKELAEDALKEKMRRDTKKHQAEPENIRYRELQRTSWDFLSFEKMRLEGKLELLYSGTEGAIYNIPEHGLMGYTGLTNHEIELKEGKLLYKSDASTEEHQRIKSQYCLKREGSILEVKMTDGRCHSVAINHSTCQQEARNVSMKKLQEYAEEGIDKIFLSGVYMQSYSIETEPLFDMVSKEIRSPIPDKMVESIIYQRLPKDLRVVLNCLQVRAGGLWVHGDISMKNILIDPDSDDTNLINLIAPLEPTFLEGGRLYHPVDVEARNSIGYYNHPALAIAGEGVGLEQDFYSAGITLMMTHLMYTQGKEKSDEFHTKLNTLFREISQNNSNYSSIQCKILELIHNSIMDSEEEAYPDIVNVAMKLIQVSFQNDARGIHQPIVTYAQHQDAMNFLKGE